VRGKRGIGEEIMIWRGLVAIGAVLTAFAVFSAPAEAATAKKKRAVYTEKRVAAARGSTVYSSRDEDGRRRTRIIVQRRSYLDPGTEVFPGEQRYNSTNGLILPTSRTFSPDQNTVFNRNEFLPGPFELPSRNNPAQW
jgi:hypothetical protein